MQWNLIRLRKENKLKQKNIAEALGISVVSYGNKERGNIQFSSDEMFALSKYFNKPLEQIFLPRNCTDGEVRKKK